MDWLQRRVPGGTGYMAHAVHNDNGTMLTLPVVVFREFLAHLSSTACAPGRTSSQTAMVSPQK